MGMYRDVVRVTQRESLLALDEHGKYKATTSKDGDKEQS